MTEPTVNSITKDEVQAAQQEWASCVVAQDLDKLLGLYDFDAPLLFKPTLSDTIRLDRKGAIAYFVGGDSDYPHDNGFLKNGWQRVEFVSAAGPVIINGGLECLDMGQYTFYDGEGNGTLADYTFVYRKIGGRLLIALQHSSLTWDPAAA